MTEIDDKRVEAAARALKTLTIGPFGPNALALLNGGYKVQLDGGEAEEFARAALEAADAVTTTAEMGRCGDRAPVLAGNTLPLFCHLPHGHAGWHKAGNAEWTPGEVRINIYSKPTDKENLSSSTTPETVDEGERTRLASLIWTNTYGGPVDDLEGVAWQDCLEIADALLAAGYRRHDPDEVRRALEIDRDALISTIRPAAIGGAGYLDGNPDGVVFGFDGSIDVGDIADAVIAFIREVGQ